ncbi:Murein DD-endopeptidase MepM and murein hydrolase activator NlpD, contain LysM domain [Granulicella rosea]|uniref:Murein DD-endopeptidase MepM and murein hydrolase activator NlpD, contain LysM domain n=1 Tax=Granulicella rosea TaxID=474952 RepID=A0A239LA16_9BACT|nr:M23 family metallopeptidase [Granulicella rosea]SNT26768.1 Murein DD-endopeptidase MepM and murein hydrolase activator NlpD, contain LysM domain [Granulicella rosea]
MTTTTRIRFALAFVLSAIAAQAQQPVTYTPTVIQSGSPILFRATLPEARALTGTWQKHPVTFTQAPDKSWYLLAGVDVEQTPGVYTLDLVETLASGATKHLTREIAVGAAHYRTGALTVAPSFLAPDPATVARAAEEKAIKDKAFATNTPQVLWSGDFARPVASAGTDSFGTRRTFNGKLASIHRGADFRAAMGTPVYASNEGIVLIAQQMFYEGGFVVLDHGQQFSSMYMHFSRIDVKPGEHIHKGQRLGLSGATGRVTGPHLHFAIRWQGAYLDPNLLLKLPLPANK